MKTIREIYEEKQQQELEEGFVAGLTAAATALGFTAIGGLAVFGGAVLVASAKKAKLGNKIKALFAKIAGKETEFNLKKGTDKLKQKSGIREMYDNYKKSEIAEKLSNVLAAISRRDYEEALSEYRASGEFGNDDAIRIIALAVTEEFGEPPLYYISPGNGSFQFLKRIVGPRTAKAVADSVMYALNKNKSYFSDIEVMRTSRDREEDSEVPKLKLDDEEDMY